MFMKFVSTYPLLFEMKIKSWRTISLTSVPTRAVPEELDAVNRDICTSLMTEAMRYVPENVAPSWYPEARVMCVVSVNAEMTYHLLLMKICLPTIAAVQAVPDPTTFTPLPMDEMRPVEQTFL